MEWRDEGLVLAARRHGERDSILEVMTREHGRHFGLVRGGRSSRQAPMLQPGNRVELTWRARLEEHLGAFSAETLQSRAGILIQSPAALHALNHIATLVRLLPEREPHPHVYEAADALCALAAEPIHAGEMLARFELMMLDELGFGLDLSECVATGSKEHLIYVSPRSGRAVCAEAGAPYAERLLPLSSFLCEPFRTGRAPIPREELENAFRMLGYFYDRDVFGPRNMKASDARDRFITLLARFDDAG
jgi:DNA repair protein RecO (recombination protein O)